MKIGCPKEIKPQEFRVGMTPNAAREAIAHGHEVMIETNAGTGAGFPDADYIAAGAKIIGTVEELFAKVPARRKFLRTARSEYAACLDVVRRLAMARPDVGFTLETVGDAGKRTVLSLQAGEELATRVARIIAHELKDNSVPIELERETPHGVMRLPGVAGLPTWNRGVADHQYLVVNGRPVKDRLLVGAVRGAYADMLARDRHAVLALFLNLPPEEVDVNVHPAKTEVRFRDAAQVRGMIVSGLRRALDEAGHRASTQVSGAALAAFVSEPLPSAAGAWPPAGGADRFTGRPQSVTGDPPGGLRRRG